MKVMLIGVQYCEGKYRSTKLVEKMLTSVGHELVSAPAEGVTCCVGRLMPFEAPKKPDSLLKAESMKLAQTTLDALMCVQPAAPAEKPKRQPKTTSAKRGKKEKKAA